MKAVYLVLFALISLAAVLFSFGCAKPSSQKQQAIMPPQSQSGAQENAPKASTEDILQGQQSSGSLVNANASATATNEWLLGFLPSCNGVNTLPHPVSFAWPNFSTRKRQLKGSSWGYFTCAQTPADVSQLYRERLPKPPFLMKEVQWVPRREGTLGVFHSSASDAWIYVWVVPQPGNAQNTLVVVANNYGSAASFSCRLWGQPPLSWIDSRGTAA